jgi:phosphoglycerol transferase MdoB-like AlkP superfamily enzyme
MTASDHGPWRIPQNISFKPSGASPQENCTQYADWAIGQFMEKAKKCSWYNNTVFMFLGDHGVSLGHTYEMPIAYHHVPFIIHQPAFFEPDTVSSPAYQPDVPATALAIAGGTFVNETFGINLLKDKHPFVVFSADDKLGCVDSTGWYYYTLNNGQTYLRRYAALDWKNYRAEQSANVKQIHKEMTAVYETARYLLNRDYAVHR